MIYMVILKAMFVLYSILLAVLILTTLSRFIFRESSFWSRVEDLKNDLFFLMFFPLMIFSKEGISKLVKKIKEIA